MPERSEQTEKAIDWIFKVTTALAIPALVWSFKLSTQVAVLEQKGLSFPALVNIHNNGMNSARKK